MIFTNEPTSKRKEGDYVAPLFCSGHLVDELQLFNRERNRAILAKEDESSHRKTLSNPPPRRGGHGPAIVRHDQPPVLSGPLENDSIVRTFKSGFPHGAGVHVWLPPAKTAYDVTVEVFVKKESNAAHAARVPLRRRASIRRRRPVRNCAC